jgi:predicted anti-sigma-YlaC factor YlaD
MHAVVMDNLEEYLSGTLRPANQRSIEAHLKGCESCRQELTGMQDLSQLFGSLAYAQEEMAPAPGFYAQVMRKVGDRHAVPSFAGLFALDFAFGRRLVFSSLLTFAVLGTYLVTREVEYPTGLSPDAIMAQQDLPAFDSARAQDNMLATMTTYEP